MISQRRSWSGSSEPDSFSSMRLSAGERDGMTIGEEDEV